MHINWKGAKQRPNFLAEGLSKYYDITIYYLFSVTFLFKKLVNVNNIKMRPYFFIPFFYKKGVSNLNEIFLKIYFRFLFKLDNSNYLWITYPSLYEYIPSNHKYKMIYDCFDDALEFTSDEKYKSKLLGLEKELVNKSSLIFVSSNNLALKLNERNECGDKLVLIRNAFDGNILPESINANKKRHNVYKIGYIGAIAEWLDLDLLYSSLNHYENIEYHLIGPIHGINTNQWKHKRIKFYGLIQHEELASFAQEFDCLIMPFKLTELIKSVDPIKIYEYINFNKPIISIFYDEIKYFDPFVYFYNNEEEFFNLLNYLINSNFNKKYNNKERISFLKNNTWNKRINEIMRHLKKLENK